MTDLARSLIRGQDGLRFFSLTPPKHNTPADRLDRINTRRSLRINALPVDGIMIYDVREETGRTGSERPYAYRRFMDSIDYADRFSRYCSMPQVRYVAVSRVKTPDLESIFRGNLHGQPVVLVGHNSSLSAGGMRLPEAYRLHADGAFGFPLGGVTIGERHRTSRNEAQAMLRKIQMGVSFFVSQCVYDPSVYEKLLTDYAAECKAGRTVCKPVIFTLTPVIDDRGIALLEWLGVSIPQSFKNTLRSAADKDSAVMSHIERTADRLVSQCGYLGIPYGLNFESVLGGSEETGLACMMASRAYDAGGISRTAI